MFGSVCTSHLGWGCIITLALKLKLLCRRNHFSYGSYPLWKRNSLKKTVCVGKISGLPDLFLKQTVFFVFVVNKSHPSIFCFLDTCSVAGMTDKRDAGLNQA